MPSHLNRLALFTLSLTTALLSSCGGGSGDSPPAENNKPVATSGNLAVKKTASRSGTLQATDADGDALTFTIVTAPGMGTISSPPDADGNFTYTPDANAQPGENDVFTFTASDGQDDSAPAAFTINLVAAPTAAENLDYGVTEGGSVPVDAADGVVETADNPIGETLTATLISAPAHDPAFVLNPDGSFNYNHDGSEDMEDTFDFRLTADNGDEANGTAVITIAPVNDTPIPGTPVGCQSVTRSQAFAGNVLATDPDLDLLSYSIDSNGSKGFASIDMTTGAFTYTPNGGTQTGIDSFTVLIDDNQGGEIFETINMNIAVRVMPMGDSITEGVTGPGSGSEPLPATGERIGYRMKLKQLLLANGYSIDFVGTRDVAASDLDEDPVNGNPFGGYGYNLFPEDFESEGHGGTGASYFSTNTANHSTWLTPSDPEIVLLHIGTNDFKQNNNPAPVADDIEDTVNNIRSYGTGDVQVFVARIIGQHPDNTRNITEAHVTSFNNKVENAVKSLSNVHVVDLFSALEYDLPASDDDFGDSNKHPSQSGYNKMAAKWADDLAASGELEKCPGGT